MTSSIAAIKQRVEAKLAELRTRRKNVIDDFGARLQEKKIEEIKNSLRSDTNHL